MSNFTATGMFVPIAFALSALKAPVTLTESSHRWRRQVGWTYEVRYLVREENGFFDAASAELTVENAQLDAAYDPGELVSSIIVALLHEVKFPDTALAEARSVAEFVHDGGTFGAELVGGFHDGATYTDLPLDRDLFPPAALMVPLPRPGTVSGVGGNTDGDLGSGDLISGAETGSVTYRRDRLDPNRRIWLYRM